MEERRPQAGEKYRHFKNKLYQIVGIAIHSETREELVIYQALYGDFSIYARPLSMFVSEVDHEKYPEVRQKYRFEHVIIGRDGNIVSAEEESNPSACGNRPGAGECEEAAFAGPGLMESAGGVFSGEEEAGEEGGELHPLLLEFFDAETLEERYNILVAMRDVVDDGMIDSMAVVCDLVIKEGSLMDRYDELKKAIATRQKYELSNRLR